MPFLMRGLSRAVLLLTCWPKAAAADRIAPPSSADFTRCVWNIGCWSMCFFLSNGGGHVGGGVLRTRDASVTTREKRRGWCEGRDPCVLFGKSGRSPILFVLFQPRSPLYQ